MIGINTAVCLDCGRQLDDWSSASHEAHTGIMQILDNLQRRMRDQDEACRCCSDSEMVDVSQRIFQDMICWIHGHNRHSEFDLKLTLKLIDVRQLAASNEL